MSTVIYLVTSYIADAIVVIIKEVKFAELYTSIYRFYKISFLTLIMLSLSQDDIVGI